MGNKEREMSGHSGDSDGRGGGGGEEDDEALTCLVIVVDFDHSWFQVPHWQILLQHHKVRHLCVLLQLRHSKHLSSSL